MDSLAEVAHTIRVRRKKLGLRQVDLARFCGLSQPEIARIENYPENLNPAYSTIYQIVDFLDRESPPAHGNVLGRALDVMKKPLVFVDADTPLAQSWKIMWQNQYSQLPVMGQGHAVGCLYQLDLPLVEKRKNLTARDAMGDALPEVPANSDLSKIRSILHDFRAVLVVEKGQYAGIVTPDDLFKVSGIK